MNAQRRERWAVALSLFAAIVWWGYSSVRSAASLVVPRDPVEYAVGAVALIVFALGARRLPARGSLLALGAFFLYTVVQFLARGAFSKVSVLSLIQIVFPVSFLPIGYLLWQKRRFDIPVRAYVVLMAISSVLGLMNYYTGFAEPLFLLSKLDRAEVGSEVVQRGGSLASGSIGTGLLVAIGILLASGLPRRYWLAIPIFGLSLLSTLSRGGIIAILAGIPVVLWFGLPRDALARRRILRTAGMAAFALFSVLLVVGLSTSGKSGSSVILDRFVGDLANTKEEGNSLRVDSWENAIHVWSEEPVFGAGLGEVGTIGVIDARERGRFALAAESWYLQIIAELGAVGLGLYLLTLYGVFSEGIQAITLGPSKRERAIAIGALAGLTSLAVGGIFLQNLSDLIGTLFWYFAGGLLAYRSEVVMPMPRRGAAGGSARSPIARRSEM